MIKKSRFVLAIGLVLALGVGSLAFADGASDNTAFVDGGVTPKKLDKKKFKPVNLFSGVRTEVTGGVNGLQANPTVEYISYDKNIKFDFNAGDVCTTLPPSGSTPDQAKAACPKSSYLGSGEAEVQGPGIPPITDITVSVFRGPAKNGIQLHTFSPTLGQAAPTVLGSIVKSNAGSKFGYALSVPNAPETGATDDHEVQRDHQQGQQGRLRALQEQEVDVPAHDHVQRRLVGHGGPVRCRASRRGRSSFSSL